MSLSLSGLIATPLSVSTLETDPAPVLVPVPVPLSVPLSVPSGTIVVSVRGVWGRGGVGVVVVFLVCSVFAVSRVGFGFGRGRCLLFGEGRGLGGRRHGGRGRRGTEEQGRWVEETERGFGR